MSDRRDTLLLPFERDIVEAPTPDGPFIFLNAEPFAGAAFGDHLVCEQGFRPLFLQLEKAGYTVEPHITENSSERRSGALVLLGRSRRKNEADIARAWGMVADGAPILVAGTKTDGIAPIRKWTGTHMEIAGSLSKHHAVVFWFARTNEATPFPTPGIAGAAALPGMFSADAPDIGSQILTRHFGERISGAVADFGAGWGYLGMELLGHCPGITKLENFEADWLSLEACKRNLSSSAANRDLEYHWADLTSEAVSRRFDWVIMNPPFHAGRAAQPAIGQAFVAAASKALKPGGRLFMVANRNLPYERALEEGFAKVEKLEEANGFKVFEARR